MPNLLSEVWWWVKHGSPRRRIVLGGLPLLVAAVAGFAIFGGGGGSSTGALPPDFAARPATATPAVSVNPPTQPASQPAENTVSTPTPALSTYQVRAGDTLGAICGDLVPGLPLDECVSQTVTLNGLASADQIAIDQVLQLPGGSVPDGSEQNPSPGSNPADSPSGDPDPADNAAFKECLAVSEALLAVIASGLTVDGESSLRNGWAVRSEDFVNVFFVAADIEGPGLGSDDEIGVWATNSLVAGDGVIIAVNAAAKEFSSWPTTDTSEANVVIESDGAQEARACS